MKTLLTLALLATAPAPVDHPQTFLLSIVGVPLKAGDSLDRFSISTWGVEFNAVCHIPSGWTIKAGGSATLDGTLAGEGSLGATWLSRESLRELHGIVLVTLYTPVQRRDIVSHSGRAVVPRTFKGHGSIATDDRDRRVSLTYENVQLTPAKRCP